MLQSDPTETGLSQLKKRKFGGGKSKTIKVWALSGRVPALLEQALGLIRGNPCGNRPQAQLFSTKYVRASLYNRAIKKLFGFSVEF